MIAEAKLEIVFQNDGTFIGMSELVVEQVH